MPTRSHSSRLASRTNRNGAVLVLVAIMLPVMLILSAIAINYAYIDLCDTELYTATDAAARAAGRELAVSRSQTAAITKGKSVANLNSVAGNGLSLATSDFVFGLSTRSSLNSRYSFNSGAVKKNSVQVTARRKTGSPDGPVSLFMPNILGRSSVNMQEVSISTGIEVDIALVLDRSGSMAYAADERADATVPPYSAPPGWAFCDAAPPICRWRNLVDAVGVFLNELTKSPLDELVSLSTYNDVAVTDLGLTNNYSLIPTALNPNTNSFCSGGTNIGGGINEGIGAVTGSPSARQFASKVIVVMSDGIHNIGTYPMGPAYYAADQGMMVFTVTFSDEADQYLMQQVAAVGGGKHYHANSPSDLTAAFKDIARSLPTLLTK